MSPTRSGHAMRRALAVLATASLAALALGAGLALAAPPGSVSEAEIQAALQRDLHLSAQEVKKQGALQARASARDEQLRDSLGSAYAGSIYDAERGKLVAMVTDKAQMAKVRAVGAAAKLVKYSEAKLERIKAALDMAAGVTAGSDPTERQVDGQHHGPVAGMIGWYVDAASNSVHVTVKKGRKKTAAAALAKYGGAVRIEQTDLMPTTTANYMHGGDEIRTNKGMCSAGFNLRNPSTGRGFLLTAGHCADPGTSVFGQGSAFFGSVLESWFPGYDDALVRNDNPGYWLQGPWIDINPSNGGIGHVIGPTDPPLFSFTCKSGITTKWTCGTVVGKNETVLLDGVWVNNLTRHTACVEEGDSGGPNLTLGGGVYAAAGVTSGAAMLPDLLSGGRKRCLATFGLPNVSWYYPITQSLGYYGPRYGIGI